ncbi:hypothetical protein O7606_27060 [Micromonospora sp. WMMD882]|uniref:hypothetical protein n=1 Tax=Micromonospora sp. WMMD882 TaxID=3015151 RepID=UPI00248CAA50|nr:hypothetical protein [Micromonospora sp. WMMD882]WBB79745.1 hypothetical protein O7606_27060 [Micromonospora sp. WMMD882]
MAQMSLFGPSDTEPDPKPANDRIVRLQLLITVKAAPNPSEKYGETVCVAGLRTDVLKPTWVRLYPINFRHLDSNEAFKKYDIVSVDAKPARQDQRRESWKPIMDRIQKERHLDGWRSRQPLLEPAVEDSMCRLNREAQDHADAQSLALVRPREVRALKVTPHHGWDGRPWRRSLNEGQLRRELRVGQDFSRSELRFDLPTAKGAHPQNMAPQQRQDHHHTTTHMSWADTLATGIRLPTGRRRLRRWPRESPAHGRDGPAAPNRTEHPAMVVTKRTHGIEPPKSRP